MKDLLKKIKVIRQIKIFFDFNFKIKNKFKKQILSKSSGIIHVGCNTAQERHIYQYFNKKVLWIEGNIDLEQVITNNLRRFSEQKCYFQLLTKENSTVHFHIASNTSSSSSIFKFSGHKKMYEHVYMSETRQVKSKSFDNFLLDEKIDLNGYDFLIMDVQGAELEILKGMSNNLSSFKYIQLEASDFDAYEQGCRDIDLINFLDMHNFSLQHIQLHKSLRELGSYKDIYFVNKNSL